VQSLVADLIAAGDAGAFDWAFLAFYLFFEIIPTSVVVIVFTTALPGGGAASAAQDAGDSGVDATAEATGTYAATGTAGAAGVGGGAGISAEDFDASIHVEGLDERANGSGAADRSGSAGRQGTVLRSGGGDDDDDGAFGSVHSHGTSAGRSHHKYGNAGAGAAGGAGPPPHMYHSGGSGGGGGGGGGGGNGAGAGGAGPAPWHEGEGDYDDDELERRRALLSRAVASVGGAAHGYEAYDGYAHAPHSSAHLQSAVPAPAGGGGGAVAVGVRSERAGTDALEAERELHRESDEPDSGGGGRRQLRRP
jgi:hypothetical protein